MQQHQKKEKVVTIMKSTAKKVTSEIFFVGLILALFLVMVGLFKMATTDTNLNVYADMKETNGQMLQVASETEKTYCDEQYNGYIKIIGTASESEIETLVKAIEKLPEWLILSFMQDGGKIMLSSIEMNDILEDNFGYSYGPDIQPAGFYVVCNEGFPQIWVYNNKHQISEVTLHEFGHYADDSSGWVSDSEEFYEVYGNERASFQKKISRNEHYHSSPVEYFAESFGKYLYAPELLLKNCAETYSFIENVVNGGRM